MGYLILTINPGSTSTKVSVYEDEKLIHQENLFHEVSELEKYPTAIEQLDMRKNAIFKYLKKNGIDPKVLSAIAARGGPHGKYKSGAYIVDEVMVDAAKRPEESYHPSCLSPLIGLEFTKQFSIPAYIYDVVYVDELEEIARFSGHPKYPRIGASHTLNTKAVARKIAENEGKSYGNVSYIMCHLGGGIGVNLHKNGRIVDVTGHDEGTFSPVRSGKIPGDALIKVSSSGDYTTSELLAMFNARGGLIAYLGTNDCEEVEKRISEGDCKAELIYRAMAYQVAKDIGALATVECGMIDKIVITGGLANSQYFTNLIKERTEFIAPVVIFTGSIEEEALAYGVLRVLRGEESAWEFIPGKTI